MNNVVLKLSIISFFFLSSHFYGQEKKTTTENIFYEEEPLVKIETKVKNGNNSNKILNSPLRITEDNKVYNQTDVEVKPDFPGGMQNFYKFIGHNYQTPEEDGLKGKIYFSFIVEKDGSLTDIKVSKDIGYGTGKEIIRVLKKCPKLIPGQKNGKPIRVLYSMFIDISSAE
jgi:protein TonB